MIALVALLLTIGAHASRCDTVKNVTGRPNNFPIFRGPPVLVRRIDGAELYTVGTKGGAFSYLLHLYGNDPYAWGYGTGTLLKSQVNATLTAVWAYFSKQVIDAINGTATELHIPPEMVDLIAEVGLELALDWQNSVVKPYTSPAIYDEIRGLADASGLSYEQIVRIHMIGELTRGQCSFYGAYGAATKGGKTLQLRALDWDTGASLQNNPLVTVYHPTDPKVGYPWANVGWAGWIGTLTAMSSNRLGISEIGVSYPDYPPAFGNNSIEGTPFIFVERYVVEHVKSIQEARDYIQNVNRTCQLILGVADGKASSAMMVQYSGTLVRFFNDTNLEPLASWHPRLTNVVYSGMDWNCPFYQHALWQQLQLYHGSLTPELSVYNVTSTVQTGDLHLAVYDLTDMVLYVGNHAPDDVPDGPQKAYDRPFFALNMTAMFGKPYGN